MSEKKLNYTRAVATGLLDIDAKDVFLSVKAELWASDELRLVRDLERQLRGLPAPMYSVYSYDYLLLATNSSPPQLLQEVLEKWIS